jgi:hypothetical protein
MVIEYITIDEIKSKGIGASEIEKRLGIGRESVYRVIQQ